MTKRVAPYSPEVRECAARMVFNHQGDHGSQWTTIQSIAHGAVHACCLRLVEIDKDDAGRVRP